VFREAGFAVQATKRTGDHGVDLLLTGDGRRIAVQAKGYVSSVGVDAVQQVHSGMVFYGCSHCVVVTNSVFTAPAILHAGRVGCMLVDGARMTDLIEGRILRGRT
jgi:restriction system protein